MSKVLAIDTSTSRTSVAIIDGDTVVFSGFRDGATAHGPSLPALVQEALAVSEVDEVVVGMGPGPFTGLRVGIAFAQSFALGMNVKWHGVCSLDAIAIDQSEYTVAIDARRKEIYWAQYKEGKRVNGPHVNLPTEVSGTHFVGEGAHKYGLCADSTYPEVSRFHLLSHVDQPMYLRRPDAVPTVER